MTYEMKAAQLPPQVSEAIRSARQAGHRLIVPCNTDAATLTFMAREGLTRRFFDHTVLTAAGSAVRRYAAAI